MAITDSQKVDYLWKKLGYGATKTDTNANKFAPNEAIASPLLLRGDKVWQQASSIATVLPGSNTAPVTVYTTSLPYETTEDITATANRTWKTGLTDWIPPEVGSTYQAKVYIHTSNDAGNAASSGTQVFATGSGNNDEWFFDYQSGVLHFIGTNLPNGVSFTGKSVYISGGRYTGVFGVGSAGGEDANLGNLTISNVTISSSTAADPIILDAEDGIVKIAGTTGFVIPLGNTAQRPGTPESGTLRYNSSTEELEIYDGSSWNGLSDSTASITSEVFSGNGVANVFTLSSSATTNTVFVSINGTLQQPTTTYTVSGTTLTFAEAPATGDTVEVRKIVETQTVASLSNSTGNAYIITNDSGITDIVSKQTSFTGNVLLGTYTKTTPVVVANLPAAGTVGAGSRAFVSDANTATFGSAVGGSGAINVPVYSDGSNWRVG